MVAVTINHESLPDEQIPLMCDAIEQTVGLPTFDALRDGPDELVNLIKSYANDHLIGEIYKE